MYRIKQVLFTLFLFTFCFVYGQDEQPDPEIDNLIQDVAEQWDGEVDFTTTFEDMEYYLKHPLNLNTATKEELMDLQYLNPLQINNLILHIEKYGKMLMLEELQAVEGFDMLTINMIKPFVQIDESMQAPHISVGKVFTNGKHEVFVRSKRILEMQEGYMPIDDSSYVANPNSRYLGNPYKVRAQYKFNYNNQVRWGITGEKDEGEEFFGKTQPRGFDFYSAHFYMKNMGIIKQFAIGDYQVNMGQGLTMWSGLVMQSSDGFSRIKRNASGIKPYTSVNEGAFLRGAAITLGGKKISLTGFYSTHKVDANLFAVDSSGALIDDVNPNADYDYYYVSSFDRSGLHNTPSLVENKELVRENVFGGDVKYKWKSAEVGMTSVTYQYTIDVSPSYDPYKLYYQFLDNSFTSNFGAYYNFFIRNLNFFGEAAANSKGGYAYVNGMLAGLSPNFSLALHQRYYSSNYFTFMGNAFSQTTSEYSGISPTGTNTNEQGWYVGFAANPVKYWTLTAYYDIFKYPWLRYQVDAPSDGHELFTQLSYKPSKKLKLYIRFREVVKQENTSEDTKIDYLENYTIRIYRFNLVYNITKPFHVSSRAEVKTYKKGNEEMETGFLTYTEFSYKPIQYPFSVTWRMTMFDTDSYDTRIYTYERDFFYYIPFYYYKGLQTYLMTTWRINKFVDVKFKIGRTIYTNRDVISSGLNEIQGNTQTTIKGQLRIKF